MTWSNGAPDAKAASLTLKRRSGWDSALLDGLTGGPDLVRTRRLTHNLIRINSLPQ